MPPQMKGLTQFILDLRNSKDLSEENKRINLELNNIQTKFSTSLNGYQKKKYICKIIYIYLLGYSDSIDFGLKESYQLLASSSYSEKQLGYLSISILTTYDKQKYPDKKEFLNDFIDSTHSYLVKDLGSDDEDINCLALQFIATSFNINESTARIVQIKDGEANTEKWLELIDIAYAFCTSPIKKSLIKKKASITLLTLLKLYPDVIISNTNWIPRLLSLIDNEDLGVIVASVPLIQYIMKFSPNIVKAIIPPIASRLVGLVVDNDCPENYFYYKTPAPWLIIKLLQLVEHFFLLTNTHGKPLLTTSDIDEQTLSNLRTVVARSIQNASQPIKGLPNRNSQSSILFQSVSLAVFLDASVDAINGAINALMTLINSPETNTRYLALDALIKLTARSQTNYLSSNTNKFDENLPKIFHLLYDKDISVKRKALDLIYTICNSQTYNNIVNQLLDFFPYADFSLKSELAIKLAILAERFATDSTWYVTTMLKLLSIGGGSNSNGIGYISNEVWERIVQIVVNNEALQTKTCKLIINLLKAPIAPNPSVGRPQPVIGLSENLVKVAAFVLGEYGDQVNDSPEFAIGNQFKILYQSYFKVSLNTRAMLLTTFLKFFVKFPDESFIPDIVDLYDIECQSIDLEIQTRASEYFKLVTTQSNPKLIDQIIKPLPVFVRTESPLMNRIGSVSHIIGRNRSSSIIAAKNINTKSGNGKLVAKNLKSTSTLALPTTNEDILENHNESEEELSDASYDPFEEKLPVLTSNWYPGYHRMLHYDAGIFFENQLIKLTYRIVKEKNNITIKFVIINNSAKTAGTDITGFTVLHLRSLAGKEDPSYLLNLRQLPDSTIHEKSSIEIDVKVRNVVENSQSPIISIKFTCGGSFNQLHLKFPVSLLKTLSSASLNSLDDFKKRWLQIGELLGIQQGEHVVKVDLTHRYNSSNIVRLLSRLGFSVVHSTPDNMDAGILVMGGGILYTQQTNYGLLTTIKSVDNVGKEFEIVVRCTGGGIAEIVASNLKEIFEGKF